MNNKVTIVSGLFYIGRDRWKYSGFPANYDRYKDWVKNLLSLDINLYFYVDEIYHDYVEEIRRKYDPNFDKTVLIKTSLDETHFYKKYYAQEACLMKSPKVRHDMYFKDNADMNYPLYHIVNFSKIDFVRRSYEDNKFNSDYFFWIDAGGMRESLETYENYKWPIESDVYFNDKLIHFSHKEDFELDNKKEHFLSQVRNIQGTAWIVPKDKVISFFDKIDNQVQTIIDEQIVGSDEKVYDFLYVNDKQFYQLVKCGWFEFFNILNQY